MVNAIDSTIVLKESSRMKRTVWLVLLLLLSACPAAADFRVVGVLGNTAGMGRPAIPYAFYTGIAVDSHGRLWLAGVV